MRKLRHEELPQFLSRKLKTLVLDRGHLALEIVQVTSNHPTIPQSFSKLGVSTYLGIFKFSLFLMANQFLFFPKISFDSILDFSFPQPNIDQTNFLLALLQKPWPILSKSNSSLSSSKSFDDCSLLPCQVQALTRTWHVLPRLVPAFCSSLISYSSLCLSTYRAPDYLLYPLDQRCSVLPHYFSLTALPCPLHISQSHSSFKTSANANSFRKHSLMPSSQNLSPISLLQSCRL